MGASPASTTETSLIVNAAFPLGPSTGASQDVEGNPLFWRVPDSRMSQGSAVIDNL